MPNTKFCKKCQNNKNITEFHKNSQTNDGLQAKCKQCVNEYNQTYHKKTYRPKREKMFNDGQRKQCRHCNNIYTNDWFPPNEGYRCYRCKPGSGLYKSATQKQCRICNQIKDRSDFKSGNLCNECLKQDSQRRQIRRYGITELQYWEMHQRQNGLCAICNQPERHRKRLSIDHDHSCCSTEMRSCGKCVRGLLCSKCNRILGLALDSDQVLLNAAKYLKAYQQL